MVVCASGSRSALAADQLAQQGLRVANLRGGMAAWGALYDWVVVDVDRAVRVVQVRRRGKGCLSYVVGAGDEAFVVDPSLDIDVYLEVAAEHGWRIRRVFDTHLHADHVSGARSLAARVGATLHLNPADSFNFGYAALHDGESFALGGSSAFSVAALRTPGHTEGSTVYFVDERVVLTGDTLFVDGVGRPDLAERAEEFAHNLYRSLHERVLTLPEDALVMPGHYGDAVRVRADAPVAATLGSCGRRWTPWPIPRRRSSRGRRNGRRRGRRTTSRSSTPTWAGPSCRTPLCATSRWDRIAARCERVHHRSADRIVTPRSSGSRTGADLIDERPGGG